MNVSIPPAAADEAGRLAELSAKATANLRDTVLNIIHAAGGDPTRIDEAVESLRSLPYRLVPATPTQSGDSDGRSAYHLGVAAEGIERGIANAGPDFPGYGEWSIGLPFGLWPLVLNALRATPAPPAPSRDLVEAMRQVRAELPKTDPGPAFDEYGYKSHGNYGDVAADGAAYAEWQIAQKLDAVITEYSAATQAPAKPSQGAEASCPPVEVTQRKLTSAEIGALQAAKTDGNPFLRKGIRQLAGGAYRRMCERLAHRGLLTTQWEITPAGDAALSQSAGGR